MGEAGWRWFTGRALQYLARSWDFNPRAVGAPWVDLCLSDITAKRTVEEERPFHRTWEQSLAEREIPCRVVLVVVEEHGQIPGSFQKENKWCFLMCWNGEQRGGGKGTVRMNSRFLTRPELRKVWSVHFGGLWGLGVQWGPGGSFLWSA